ncbi:unnamed protein product, partial [Sphacelaria rigidula]
VELKLDGYHAIQRVTKLVPKAHGGAALYTARFRDAIFRVHKKDFDAAVEPLRHSGHSEEEIEERKRKGWRYFLSKCRRFIPPPAELVKRFDLLHRVYGNVIDKKTKQPLLRPEAWEAVKRLRQHIIAGSISDPTGVPLYFETGKDPETGAPQYRCVRGTNDLEGYHLRMRMLTSWVVSPRLANGVLLEHNCQWNMRQGDKNRRFDPAVAGFFDQPVIEAI